jgi:hypothetical protein
VNRNIVKGEGIYEDFRYLRCSAVSAGL